MPEVTAEPDPQVADGDDPAAADPAASPPTEEVAASAPPGLRERVAAWWYSGWPHAPLSLPFRQPPARDALAEVPVLAIVTPRTASRHDLKAVVF